MRITSIIICTMVFHSLSAQVSFTPQRYTQDFFAILRHCVVDMNGDHKDDIVGVSTFRVDIAYQTDNGFDHQTILKSYNEPKWSICAGDIDNNGYNDLCSGGETNASFLYANANGTDFEEVLMPDDIFSQRNNFADIDNDGHLDAFICHDLDQNHPYRNDGNGQLILDQSLLTTPEEMAGNYVSSWVDYDNDGDMDMYLTKCISLNTDPDNPALINQLYNNDGNGNYTEVAASARLDDSAQSWVSHWEDFDNDGDFDVFITNHNMSHRLMRNNGDGTFTDVIEGSGMDKTGTLTVECFSADFDNDGDMDIMMDKPNVIYYNNGNMTFTTSPIAFNMGAIGDLNSDGFLDMQFSNLVYYNEGNDNHWIRINPIGRSSNRNGIGAKMEIYGDWGKQMREVRCGTSWTPMSTLGIHFGIGQHVAIDSLVVRWPSGMRTVIENPAIDQALTVDEWDCPVGFLTIEVMGGTVLCTGETTTLQAPDNYIYDWSTGATTRSIVVDSTGYYNVELIDPDTGCNLFTENIYIKNESDPLDIFAPDGTSFCSGTPVRLEVNADSNILWSTGDTTRTIWVTEPGTYSAEVQNNCGENVMTQVITMEEIVVESPVVEDTYVSSGGSAFLTADAGLGTVLWWGDLTLGSFITQGDLFLNDIVADTIYYAERWISTPGGQTCVSDRVPAYVYITTSTTDDDSDELISIYPNPATTEIKLTSASAEISQYDILDITGKVLFSETFNGATETRVQVDELTAGLYFINVELGGAWIMRQITIVR